ncbi:E3 SUMO-protein ligase PIAS1-like isoform X2 [Ctenocephalides felis]|uniref:E3 SUMO-protein ligase PIAS1-like isoform X2 n=1 Tax=Ctenocephalides felis TaxID=7515 RepID=UPI000E6E1930|nr:E3 SUMO-protein ligase PIAS1-like isoform X2 [Ctenocephalides felis]XP_026461574.1 E3 SUMO-protein ligase PIAS1-like isoform X2 [Ctenocephalides felis]
MRRYFDGILWPTDTLNGVQSNLPPTSSADLSVMHNSSMMPTASHNMVQQAPAQIRANNYQQMMYGRDVVPMPVNARAATAGTVYPPAMYYQNINRGFTNSIHVPADVRFKRLPFYDIKAELLKPSSLVPQTPQRIQECTFSFTLTAEQATKIASGRDASNPSKVDYPTQVQMRFCLLDPSCEQDDNFPPNVVVKINNKLCQLPSPIPTNRPNVEAKRPSRPVNVSNLVKLNPYVANVVNVSWVPDYNKPYSITINLVKRLTSSDLLQRLQEKGLKPPEFTRDLIKQKLNDDSDDIMTTVLNASLTCPVGKIRMVTPCRPSTCDHLQCFDASLFLQMNEKKATWICPVCDRPALYDNLMIDGYFQELIQSPTFISANVNEVILLKDGSWSIEKKEPIVQKKTSKTSVEIICDDVEIISVEDFKGDEPTSTTTTVQPNAPSTTSEKKTNETIVDLTISDSEEDAPPKKDKEPSAAQPTSQQLPPASSTSSADPVVSNRSTRYGTRLNSANLTSSVTSSLSSSGYSSFASNPAHSTSVDRDQASLYQVYPSSNTTLAHQGSYVNTVPLNLAGFDPSVTNN